MTDDDHEFKSHQQLLIKEGVVIYESADGQISMPCCCFLCAAVQTHSFSVVTSFLQFFITQNRSVAASVVFDVKGRFVILMSSLLTV